MKYKLILISLYMTFSISHIYGQERTNRVKLTFEKTSETLLKAIGWSYNSTLGEWIDYANVISDEKEFKNEYKSLQGAYMMSQTSQNFLKMLTRTVTFKGTTYYVIIIDKWSGQYEYPAIKEDWYEFKETSGYIYTKEEYQKLFSFESLIELKTKYIVSMGSKYENYNEIVFLDLIQTELSKEKSDYSFSYTFPFLKSKEGAIRFYLPDYSTHDFEKEYFEADFDSFKKIVIK